MHERNDQRHRPQLLTVNTTATRQHVFIKYNNNMAYFKQNPSVAVQFTATGTNNSPICLDVVVDWRECKLRQATRPLF